MPGCWEDLTSVARGCRHQPCLPPRPSPLLAQDPCRQEAAAHPEEKAGSKMQSQVRPGAKAMGTEVLLRAPVSVREGQRQAPQCPVGSLPWQDSGSLLADLRATQCRQPGWGSRSAYTQERKVSLLLLL